MTSIAPNHRLTDAIRTQAESLRARRAAGPPGRTSASPRASGASLQALVALRVRALSPDDPQRRPKAVRIFLETALLRELGARLVQDPGFPALVDAVHTQMQQDPELARAMDRLGALLVSG